MPVLSNPRHERFAQELAKGKSASAAYVAAGFEPNRHNAARLNTNEHIQDRVEELLLAGAKRAEVTVERVMREYARIGFADIRRAVQWQATQSQTGEEDEDGTPLTTTLNEVVLVDSDAIDRDTALAIAEIAQTKDGLKVKFHDKKGALDSMGKHLGMFKETVDLNAKYQNADEAEIDRHLLVLAKAAGVLASDR